MASTSSSVAPLITLNNGITMPQLGYGTSPLSDEEVAPAIVSAIEAGYRLVDTAEKYGNETGVGKGVRDSGLAREELFITTKFDGKFQGGDKALGAMEESLRRLGTDYVDLLLIHWPLPQRGLYVDTWRTFEKLLNSGKTRAIGVSNFKPAHLDRLRGESEVIPAVNQIMLNPSVARGGPRAYHEQHGIVTEAFSPLGSGTELLEDPIITEVASRYDKTPAQVVLRWHLQFGIIAIPRSRNAQRIRQNIDVFDFTLSPEDMNALSALDRGEAAAPDSDTTGH